MNQNEYKVSKPVSDKIFAAFVVIFLASFVIITLYPVINTVALSFNDGIDAVRGGFGLYAVNKSVTCNKRIVCRVGTLGTQCPCQDGTKYQYDRTEQIADSILFSVHIMRAH